MEVSGEVADLLVKEGLEAAKIAAELSAKGALPSDEHHAGARMIWKRAEQKTRAAEKLSGRKPVR